MQEEKAVHRVRDRMLSFLVVLAGVFATDTILFSKYCYMAIIGLLGLLGLIHVGSQNGSVVRKLGNNSSLACLGLYMFMIVAGKQIVNLVANGISGSLTAGFGNVIYVIGAALFFSLYSIKKIRLFCSAYIITFCGIFLFTGKWTLYDLGDVSRTIGIYLNPNILALFSLGTLFFSLLFYSRVGKAGKVGYLFSGALATASILNSGSRAMYIGMISAILLVILISARKNVFKLQARSLLIQTCISLFVMIAMVLLFMPRMENAIIDNVHDIDKTDSSVCGIIFSSKSSENDSGDVWAESDNIVENQEKFEEKQENSVVQVKPQRQVNSQIEIHNEKNAVMSKEDSTTGIDRLFSRHLTLAGAISTNRRFAIWKRYLERFGEYWLFGTGPNEDGLYFPEFSRIYVPHNLFVNIVFKYGFFALPLLMLALWKCFRPIMHKKHSLDSTICLFCMLSCCVFSLFHDTIDYPIFWCIFALTLRMI